MQEVSRVKSYNAIDFLPQRLFLGIGLPWTYHRLAPQVPLRPSLDIGYAFP